MRRFTVWLSKQVPGVSVAKVPVEMPDDATDEECDAACRETLEDMIGNELDTGWSEDDAD